mmetsp:Transcript_16869/g.40713  ORF Transcript_16869/g.40713 Transcript_16869/m.40713 type:complete len:252 (-) Transcript_16869:1393-2148(-)
MLGAEGHFSDEHVRPWLLGPCDTGRVRQRLGKLISKVDAFPVHVARRRCFGRGDAEALLQDPKDVHVLRAVEQQPLVPDEVWHRSPVIEAVDLVHQHVRVARRVDHALHARTLLRIQPQQLDPDPQRSERVVDRVEPWLLVHRAEQQLLGHAQVAQQPHQLNRFSEPLVHQIVLRERPHNLVTDREQLIELVRELSHLFQRRPDLIGGASRFRRVEKGLDLFQLAFGAVERFHRQLPERELRLVEPGALHR